MAETQAFVSVNGVSVPVSNIPWNGSTGAAQAITLRDPVSGAGAFVTSSNALKVDSSGQTQPISAASLPLPSGAAQDGTDATGVTQLAGGVGIRGWLSGCFSKLSSIATSVAGTLTVGGSVSVSNFPATQPVSGSVSVSNFPATQPVSGTVAVSGTVSSNATLQNGTGKNSSGTGQFLPMADSSASIDVAAGTTTTLVAGVAGKTTYVCSYVIMANGTGSVKFAYGATPTALCGAMAVTAETGVAAGTGVGILLVVPAGQDFKIVTVGAPVQGHLSYFQV